MAQQMVFAIVRGVIIALGYQAYTDDAGMKAAADAVVVVGMFGWSLYHKWQAHKA